MQSLIFSFYLLLFAWLVTRISFFKNAGISSWLLVILFFIKIAAGFAYGWLYAQPAYLSTADTWQFYNDSLKETAWLLRDPAGFIKDLFYSPYGQSGNLFSGVSSYWNDLKDNVFIKFMAVVNVFTNRDYYTNVLVFNFLYFFGPVAFYKLVLPFWNYKKEWLILPVFLLPSFLFWCSGLHKDGLLFSALMISIYCFYQQLKAQRFLWKHSLLMLFCFLFLFVLRNVILLLLLPALAALFFSKKTSRYVWLIFIGMYATGLLLFFLLPHLSPALNFPQYIIGKQAEFNALPGNSKVVLPLLQPSFSSFAHFFPYALDLLFLRPHISDLQGVTYWFAFLENTFVLVVIGFWIFFHRPLKTISPLLLFFLFFSLSVWLLCGYTVTFTGAIVRYKSLTAPLFVTFFFATFRFTSLSIHSKWKRKK